MTVNNSELESFIWSIAEVLRNIYKPHLYKSVILPMTVLRRLDCVLQPTEQDVLRLVKKWDKEGRGVLDAQIKSQLGLSFYNTSLHSFATLKHEPNKIAENLKHYIQGFSAKIQDILEHFEFERQIDKLDRCGKLFCVFQKFAEVDLHPDHVPNEKMGNLFEELIRKFNVLSKETAGEHFTPREVVRLMVDLLFAPDKKTLTKKDKVWKLLDPACGTGGMLSAANDYFKKLNPDAYLFVYGQECNDESFAVCGSDMLMKGGDISHIAFGNSFMQDQFKKDQFDYMIANPPFGVKWEAEQQFIKNEHEQEGYGGRFGAGLPSVEDGSLLFVQHMLSKMKKPHDGGSRIAIVFNGSPLFTGKAGRGESEIRKWIIESDWLEAIIALPDQLFYNTGIATYIWVLSNRKTSERKGKVQLVNGVSFFSKMRKSLRHKRHEIDEANRKKIIALYASMENGKEDDHVRVFAKEEFGYYLIKLDNKDEERVPMQKGVSEEEAIANYMEREVLPHAPEARVVEGKTKSGYEINFNRYFYEYEPPRDLAAIEKELRQTEGEIERLLKELA